MYWNCSAIVSVRNVEKIVTRSCEEHSLSWLGISFAHYSSKLFRTEGKGMLVQPEMLFRILKYAIETNRECSTYSLQLNIKISKRCKSFKLLHENRHYLEAYVQL
jgi:hypothetical protein